MGLEKRNNRRLKMFEKKRFVMIGVNTTVDLSLQIFLWSLIDNFNLEIGSYVSFSLASVSHSYAYIWSDNI